MAIMCLDLILIGGHDYIRQVEKYLITSIPGGQVRVTTALVNPENSINLLTHSLSINPKGDHYLEV